MPNKLAIVVISGDEEETLISTLWAFFVYSFFNMSMYYFNKFKCFF